MVKPRPESEETLIGVEKLAKLLDVSRSTIYSWLRISVLPKPIKFRRINHWRERDILLWLAARREAERSANLDAKVIAKMAIRSLDARGAGNRPSRRRAA